MRLLVTFTLLACSAFAHADPKAEVFAAWDAMIAAKSYRSSLQTTAAGQTFRQTVEIVVPDRMRVTGGPGGDVVITPDGAWMKLPGQDWTDLPAATAALSREQMSTKFVEKAKAGVKSVEALGDEQLAGREMRTYRIEQTLTTMGVESQMSTKLYVDVASGRPARQEVDATTMGQQMHQVQDIEYLAGIEIVAPK